MDKQKNSPETMVPVKKGDRVRNIAVTVVFALFIGVFFLLCLTHQPLEKSESERRPLAQFPEITWEGILDVSVMADFDEYVMDQFPFREGFRKLYTVYQMYVMNRKDTNNIAMENGYLAEIKKDLNEKSVNNAIEKIRLIYEKYLQEKANGDVYFSIVPDKGYFLADKGYLSLDYDKLVSMMREGLTELEYIDIFGELSLEDYYKTDTHWSQDKISAVAMKIAEAIGCKDRLSNNYVVNALENFYGVYAGQIALDVKPDTLYYLTSDILDACTVYDYETGKTGKIYDLAKFEGTDGYDVFLSGTRALLRIDNPNATTDEELIVFRDSFGSSLIPLLAEGYKSIYIVDIRYVAPSLLGRFKIPFESADVLFMYSTLILDSSFGFKGWNG
ncbi:MAG: hypothetical protein IJV98_03075 [Clostridia bacterium]|nr:hypothetical protein [Clostridia bacterium]